MTSSLPSSATDNIFQQSAVSVDLSSEDYALFGSKQCASKRHNLKRKLLSDRLSGIFDHMLDYVSDRHADGFVSEITPFSPCVWNNNSVDYIMCYAFAPHGFTTPISAASILEKAPPQDRRASIFLRIDVNGLTCGLRIPRTATHCIRNLEKLSLDGDYVTREKVDQCIAHIEPPISPMDSLTPISREKSVNSFYEECRDFSLTPVKAPRTLETLLTFLQSESPDPSIACGWMCRYHEKDDASAGKWLSHATVNCFPSWIKSLSQLSWTNENNYLKDEIDKKKKAQQTLLEKGVRVRVTEGLFAGKVGRIERIDANDTVRVEIGRIPISLSRSSIIVLQK